MQTRKLLVKQLVNEVRITDLEMRALAPSEHIIADLLEKRNKGTEDCVLTSDIAHEYNMNTLDFNSLSLDRKSVV